MNAMYYTISPSCLYEAKKCLNKMAENMEVRLVELNDNNRKQVKSCIYITGYTTGVTETEVSKILDSDIVSWLIIITQMDNPDAQENFGIIKNKWEQELHGKSAVVKIIPAYEGYEKIVFNWISDKEKLARFNYGKICAVVSMRPKTGKSMLINCLGNSTGWDMVETTVSGNDYISLCSNAAKIIYVGSEFYDFDIPEFDDCLRRSIFFFNKSDTRPLLLKNTELIKSSVVNMLRKNKWKIAEEQTSKVFVGSTLYSQFYSNITDKKWTFSDILNESEFALWDEYGLPISRSEYTMEKVELCLSSMNCIPEMKKYIYSDDEV